MTEQDPTRSFEAGVPRRSTPAEIAKAADAALAAAPVVRSVLDVGCGGGELLHELVLRVPYGEDFVGVDPDEAALASGRHDARIRLIAGDSTHLPCADGAFDLVVTLRSLHLWADQDAGLAELRRVTRRGGRVVVIDRLATKPFLARAERAGLVPVGAERLTRRALGGADLRAFVLAVGPSPSTPRRPRPPSADRPGR